MDQVHLGSPWTRGQLNVPTRSDAPWKLKPSRRPMSHGAVQASCDPKRYHWIWSITTRCSGEGPPLVGSAADIELKNRDKSIFFYVLECTLKMLWPKSVFSATLSDNEHPRPSPLSLEHTTWQGTIDQSISLYLISTGYQVVAAWRLMQTYSIK